MHRWRQVQWPGADAAGRPVLLVRLARACDEFDGKAAAECAEAIISQARAPARPFPWQASPARGWCSSARHATFMHEEVSQTFSVKGSQLKQSTQVLTLDY